MFWRKKDEESELKQKLLVESIAVLTREMQFLNEESLSHHEYCDHWMSVVLRNISKINQTLSSIELELLMARKASLDNDFPGKKDLT